MADEGSKSTILEFLRGAEGKAKTLVEISSATGIGRRDCSKLVRELEEEGKVVPGGVMAGVIGYKVKPGTS